MAMQDGRTVTDWGSLRRCDNYMQCVIADWVLEHKKDTTEKSGEVHIKFTV